MPRQRVEGYLKDMYLALQIKCGAQVDRGLAQPAEGLVAEEDAGGVPRAASGVVGPLAAQV